MKITTLFIAISLINSITLIGQPQNDEVYVLLNKMHTWHDTSNLDILPTITDNGLYIGFDSLMIDKNVSLIEKSNIFTESFVTNYKSLLKSIDQRLRNGYYDKWHVGELPPFRFANDYDPWCNCQGDNNQYSISYIGNGTTDNEFRYNHNYDFDFGFEVRIVFENDNWKISYLEGFDYENGIKRDGEE